MGVNSLPKTVTRQRRGCDLNPGSSAPQSSTLTTRLPRHPLEVRLNIGHSSANVKSKDVTAAGKVTEIWRRTGEVSMQSDLSG